MSADKGDAFDPYHKWLGIPRDQRPVTHYLLLGISPKETDAEVIEDAAIRQSTHVRTYQLGPHAEVCQRVLNEIAAARRTLLDPQKRKEYDATLPKAARPKSHAVPHEPEPRFESPRILSKKKLAVSSSKGMIAALVAGGAALLVAAVGGTILLSQPDAPVKTRPSPKNPVVANNEKKPAIVVEAKKAPEPKRIEPDKTPIVAKNADNPIQEREWRTGMPRTTTLARKTDGIAIFAGAAGRFDGWGENVDVGINRDGDWSIDARAAAPFQAQTLFLPKKLVGLFDLEKTTSVPLSRFAPVPPAPYPLCPESEGICWIGGMGGRWGGGEGFRVYVEDGMWKMLGLSQGSDVNGEAVVCRFANGIDRAKLRQSEVEWLPSSGPLKLLDVKDGFCVLTGIEGNIRSSKQRFELTVKDGAWWLDGNDEHASEPGHLVVHALRVSLTGKQPALVSSKERIVRGDATSPPEPTPAIDIVPKTDALTVQERSWRYGMPRCQTLMRGGDGIALFGGSTGGIGGAGEYVAVCANKAGDWIFEGSTLVSVTAYACCLTGLPAGFFDPEKTTTADFERDWKDSDRAPLELCSEDEGICWIGGIGGHFGSGDGVRVRREGGKWRFACSITGHSNCTGDAVVCRFGKGVDREKLRLDEVEWSPANGPLKLLDVKDGFCALTEIHGSLDSVKRAVQLTVKDGAWWLDGKDEPKKLRIRALRVSLTGNIPKLSEPEPTVAKTGKPAEVEPKKNVAVPKKDIAKPGRLPVPDATAQTASLKKLHSMIKAPGPKATAKELNNHASYVLGVGTGTKDDLTLRYVALKEAFELTYPFGDPEVAEQSIAALDEEFAVDPLAVKTALLSRASAKATASASRVIAERCDEVVHDAIAGDDLDRAEKVATLGLHAAQQTRVAAVAANATKRQNQVRDLAKMFKVYKGAAAVLERTPDDSKARTDAGSYLALGKGDWDAGLKLLAKGSDERLKALAEKDLAAPTEVDARQSLCEGWEDAVSRQQGAYKAQAAARAVHWGGLIAGDFAGLARVKFDKRIGEIEKYMPAPFPSARWTFDGNARDVIGDFHGQLLGSPKFVQGRLRLAPGDTMVTVPLPYDVRERTIETWIYLPSTDHRGNIIMRLDRIGDPGGRWDGIIFSNSTTGRFDPGSSHRHRSRDLDIPLETSGPSDLLHLAAVYAADHTVTLYRNGKVLSPPFHNDLKDPNSRIVTYFKGEAVVRIGDGMLMDVEEARLYTRALSADEIAMSYLTFKK